MRKWFGLDEAYVNIPVACRNEYTVWNLGPTRLDEILGIAASKNGCRFSSQKGFAGIDNVLGKLYIHGEDYAVAKIQQGKNRCSSITLYDRNLRRVDGRGKVRDVLKSLELSISSALKEAEKEAMYELGYKEWPAFS